MIDADENQGRILWSDQHGATASLSGDSRSLMRVEVTGSVVGLT